MTASAAFLFHMLWLSAKYKTISWEEIKKLQLIIAEMFVWDMFFPPVPVCPPAPWFNSAVIDGQWCNSKLDLTKSASLILSAYCADNDGDASTLAGYPHFKSWWLLTEELLHEAAWHTSFISSSLQLDLRSRRTSHSHTRANQISCLVPGPVLHKEQRLSWQRLRLVVPGTWSWPLSFQRSALSQGVEAWRDSC